MSRTVAVALAASLALVTMLVPGLVGPAAAQTDDGTIQILDVVEGPDDLVTLEVAIPAAIGRLAPDESNFGLTENGELVPVEVDPVTSTVDVVIVLDTSGSMQGEALQAAKGAAANFIERLPENARVGVVSFGADATVHAVPDFDRVGPLDAIGSLRASGETALWDALVLGADLVDELGSDRPYVVVLSDGDDTVSEASQSAAVASLQRADAGLYAIAIASPDADGASLDETVSEVGGQFYATDDIALLDELYVDIAGRLASRYQLSFTTMTDVERSIVVSVAADGTVATARTTLAGLAPTAPEAGERPAQVLNVSESARLGPVATPSPGALGGSTMLTVGMGAMFVAFAILGLLMVVPATQVRLDGAAGADRVAGLNHRLTSATDRFVTNRDSDGELDGALDAAGLNLRPGEFVLLSLVGALTVSLAASALSGIFAGIAMAMLATMGIYLFLAIRTGRRRRQFADQLTDTLSIMTGSLRAGRGLPQAIELVAEEAPSPTAEQFRRIVFETRVGRDMTTSMLSTAKRMKSEDLEWVTRAVDINRELGGDLTEVLDNVASTIRDRRRVARQVRALSAEGRASGWVLLALPFLMFGFLAWRTPDSAGLLTSTALGQVMLAVGMLGMLGGYLWIRKLVDLKY